jgi:hypothetical protein
MSESVVIGELRWPSARNYTFSTRSLSLSFECVFAELKSSQRVLSCREVIAAFFIAPWEMRARR